MGCIQRGLEPGKNWWPSWANNQRGAGTYTVRGQHSQLCTLAGSGSEAGMASRVSSMVGTEGKPGLPCTQIHVGQLPSGQCLNPQEMGSASFQDSQHSTRLGPGEAGEPNGGQGRGAFNSPFPLSWLPSWGTGEGRGGAGGNPSAKQTGGPSHAPQSPRITSTRHAPTAAGFSHARDRPGTD